MSLCPFTLLEITTAEGSQKLKQFYFFIFVKQLTLRVDKQHCKHETSGHYFLLLGQRRRRWTASIQFGKYKCKTEQHETFGNVWLMLGERRRRWSDIKPTLAVLNIN